MPKLLIISETIRRDLHAPLRLFTKFEIIHLYRNASYGDMKKEDFENPKAVQFNSIFDLYRQLVKYQPTHLQVPDPCANKTSFLGALVCLWYWQKYRPIIVVPFFENKPYKLKFNTIKYFLVKHATRALEKRASALFVLNKGAQKNLESLGINNKKFSRLMWASWGIDLNEFKSIPQSVKSEKACPERQLNGLKVKSGWKNILFLGRISKAKGIPQLLKMFELVKKEIKDAKLIIAGPAGDASHLIPKTCTSYVQVFGIIKNVDVPQYFRSGKVTIMPSQSTKEWEEQVGMVGLQSMACGTPIITTTSGAIPEYFKNNEGAFLFAENDCQGMAKICIKLLSDQNFHQDQSQKGRKYIADNYEVKNNIKKIEEFLLKQ